MPDINFICCCLRLIKHTEACKKLFCRIVTHLFLSVVYGCDLNDYSKVTSGRNRNGTERYIDAEDVDSFLVYTHALVRFCFVPGLKLDNKVYLRSILYRSHTKESASVNNADSAKLDKMTDVIRCGTDESLF